MKCDNTRMALRGQNKSAISVSGLPVTGLRGWAVAAVVGYAFSVSACGACPDGTEPDENCVCSDGTVLTPEECGTTEPETASPDRLDVCTDWGVLDGNLTERGVLAEMGTQCFRFSVAEVGDIRFTVSDVTQVPLLELIDDDGDRRVQASEIGASNFSFGARPPEVALALPRDEFFVRLSSGAGPYTLNVRFDRHPQNSPASDPGKAPDSTAYSYGELNPGPTSPVAGYVGRFDEFDLYQLSLQDAGTVRLTITQANVVPLIEIVRDDGDMVVQQQEIIASNFSFGARPNEVTKILDRGEYFIRCGSADTTYALNITLTPHTRPTPLDDPGSRLEDAADLGGCLAAVNEPVSGYVGPLDTDDIYRFCVDGPGTVGVTITDAAVVPLIEFIKDTGDMEIQTDEVTACNFSFGQRPAECSFAASEAGTYFMRVGSAETLYVTSLDFTP